MKILFVYERGGDDEVRALREAGHDVDFVSTAQWAYQKIMDNVFRGTGKYAAAIIHGSDDWVIEDNGLILSEYIQEQFPETLRICYTGQISQDYRDRFMRRFDVIASKLNGIEGLEALLRTIEK